MAVAEAVTSRHDSIELVDLEARIVQLCKENPKGVTDKAVQQDMTGVPAQQRVKAINRLLSMGQLELLKDSNGLVYRYKDSHAASKTKGFEAEEKLVYQIIEDAGNKGIWIRDIRFKCNLQMTQVNKILKNLESKTLIKAVKCVNAGKKRVYMLYNLEPDVSVTGGAWYSDQDFESEFVDVLNQQSLKFLQQKAKAAENLDLDPLSKRNASYASSYDVWSYISELGISNISLRVQDIETILDTLIFDGRAEMTLVMKAGPSGGQPQSRKLYRAIKPMLPVTGLMRLPCGVCPVAHHCYDGGEVSPVTCVYIKDWLAF